MNMKVEELKPIIELMNAQEERIVKKLDEVKEIVKVQNSRIGKLELREHDRCVSEKYKFWKVCAMIVVSAVVAALIMNFGVLEFLKLIK